MTRKNIFKKQVSKCIIWLLHCILGGCGFDCFAILLILGCFQTAGRQAFFVILNEGNCRWNDSTVATWTYYLCGTSNFYLCEAFICSSDYTALYRSKQSTPCHKLPITPAEKVPEPVVSQKQISLKSWITSKTLTICLICFTGSRFICGQ